MWVLMAIRDWNQLRIAGKDGEEVEIQSMTTPIPGGGKVPVTSFLPVFSTYEHAEAARGPHDHVSIHEIKSVDEMNRETDIDPNEGEEWKDG